MNLHFHVLKKREIKIEAKTSEKNRKLDTDLQLPTVSEVLGLLHHFQPGRKNAETM